MTTFDGDVPAIRIDARGDYCPLPIIKTAKAIKCLQEGELIEVLSDDPGFEHDLPAWCRSTGNQLVVLESSGTVLRGLVRRRARGPLG